MAKVDAIRLINRSNEAFDTAEQKVLRKLMDVLYADIALVDSNIVDYELLFGGDRITLQSSQPGGDSSVLLSDLISDNAGNVLTQGTDDGLYVPDPA